MAQGRHRAQSASGTAWNVRSRASAGSLFDRLLIDEQDLAVPSYGNRIDPLLRSIRRNLDRALNIHAGGAAANPRLGMADFNVSHATSSDVAGHMIAAIADCIRAAEPRISDVVVEHLPDPDAPLSLHFAVNCTVHVDTIEDQIRIDMALRDGRFELA